MEKEETQGTVFVSVEMSVYSLRFPDTGRVFYIGVAEDPYKRLYQHLRMDDTNPEKSACIAALQACGLTPFLQVEGKCHSREAAERAEAQYIEYYSAAGHPLTNQVLIHLSEARVGRKLYEYERLAQRICKGRIRYALAWLKSLLILDQFKRQMYLWQLDEFAMIAAHVR